MEADSKVSAHNTGTDAHSDIRMLIQSLTDRLNALADSDDTTLDQLSEVVAYIKANRDLISTITTDKVSVADIVDNLTTNVSNKPLSAAQGVALKALIDTISLPTPTAEDAGKVPTVNADGTYALELPGGGGGSGLGDLKLIVDHTIEEEVSGVTYTADEYPDIANLRLILINIKFGIRTTTGWWKLKCGSTVVISGNGASSAVHYYGVAEVKAGNWFSNADVSTNDAADRSLAAPLIWFSPLSGYEPIPYRDFSTLQLYGYNFTLPVGTVIKVWGAK